MHQLVRLMSQPKSLRQLIWIVTKNAVHPFRSLITRYLQRRHALFDRRAGVYTIGRVTVQELGLSPEKSVRYEATPVSFFHSVLSKLAVDYQRTVFIDFGSGKGRTLLLACHYPFRSIIGVEISPALCQIAVDNVNRYLAHRETSSEISVVCKGIDEFEYEGLGISDHLLVYIFNPCTGLVLAPAVEQLSRLAARGVSVTIIYLNPVWLDVLTNASWLRQVKYGETFDETGNSFMPYVVFQGVPAPWKETTEMLSFQFGPWVVAKWSFASLSNASSPVVASAASRPPVLTPVTHQQMPDDGTISRMLSFDGKAIRYASYRGKRFFIDLSAGSFEVYLNKFSGKTRNTLKRRVRRFAEHSGGQIDFRCYTTPEEMIEFRRHAIAVALLTYQRKIGWSLPEDEDFKAKLIEEAEDGRVYGFLLMHENRPVAYAFCRTESDVIIYALLGHDPSFGAFSPGTVLLYLVIQRLFATRKFRVFDFGGMAADYKSFFATGSVDYVKVNWFPITAKHLILVLTHYLVLRAWRGASGLKRAGASCVGTTSAMLARRFSRPLSNLRKTHLSEITNASGASGRMSKRARPQSVRR
jgi:CelD/BcsL family acetyltransferase involved in cellulose biosynthesis